MSVHDLAAHDGKCSVVTVAPDGVLLSVQRVDVLEMDLMARLTGLRMRDRWGGWDRRPFTAASRTHVSVYERC